MSPDAEGLESVQLENYVACKEIIAMIYYLEFHRCCVWFVNDLLFCMATKTASRSLYQW